MRRTDIGTVGLAGAPVSKADRAYQAILEGIRDQRHEPGDRLVLSQIAAELGMSVVPVREAIRRLQSEKLVAYERNVGATVVGIDRAEGNLLPADKLKCIETLYAKGHRVGMVGDGINDAPALARAEIGFAMAAAGTDTAIETADVALMDDDLRKIPAFVRLSRQSAAILMQNIVLALGIKAIFLAITFAGMATMWMAVFADMGVSLLVVFNGLRLLRK